MRMRVVWCWLVVFAVLLGSGTVVRAQGVTGESQVMEPPPQGLVMLAGGVPATRVRELPRMHLHAAGRGKDCGVLLEMSAGLIAAAGACVVLAARLERQRESRGSRGEVVPAS